MRLYMNFLQIDYMFLRLQKSIDPSPVETKYYKANTLPSELAGPGFYFTLFFYILLEDLFIELK